MNIRGPIVPEIASKVHFLGWCCQSGQAVNSNDLLALVGWYQEESSENQNVLILDIRAPTEGIVSDLLVSEGDLIDSGQTIANLKQF